MRIYKGFAGDAIQLDSKHVIAETQFIKEEFPMDDIRDIAYSAPNFTKNGCITITTSNNVIPIYFIQHNTPMMLEAFSILSALVKDNERLGPPRRGKDGKKIGTAHCYGTDHPVLKGSGKMKVYEFDDAFRFEYNMVDQGCTIPFGAFEKIEAYDAAGDPAYSIVFPSLQMKGDPQKVAGAFSMIVLFKEKERKRRLIFAGKRVSELFGVMAASLIKKCTAE